MNHLRISFGIYIFEVHFEFIFGWDQPSGRHHGGKTMRTEQVKLNEYRSPSFVNGNADCLTIKPFAP